MVFKDNSSFGLEAQRQDDMDTPSGSAFLLDGFLASDAFASQHGNLWSAAGSGQDEEGPAPDYASPAETAASAGGPAGEGGADDRKERLLLGIRLRKAGQVYFFPGNGLEAPVGARIVMQLEQGTALGRVESLLPVAKAHAIDSDQIKGTVQRLATAQDIAQHTENSILAAEAAAFCRTCIRQRNLGMKLVDVEVMHDRSKIIFFFTAPARIDFRELVKDLVRNYRTRIELRQIGVRHEAQMIGAIGNCGMVCCCHSYLRKFAPVTIKMAKEQNLFLNPSKLSGMCGRLLCCLSFEQGNYEEFNRRCPRLGKRYATARGLFKVLRANMFSRSVVLLSEAGEEVEMSLEEWDALEPSRAESPPGEASKNAQRPEQSRKERPRKRGGDARTRHAQPAPGPADDEAGKGEEDFVMAPAVADDES